MTPKETIYLGLSFLSMALGFVTGDPAPLLVGALALILFDRAFDRQ